MMCQCTECNKQAVVGGMLCQKCRDAIDNGNMDHHKEKPKPNKKNKK